MASDDLQFDAEQVPAPRQPTKYKPNLWTVRDRTFIVIKYLGIALFIVGACCEAQFWWFWLTSGRATATVVWKEERVVGWGFTRSGMAFPIIDTGFHYRFRDAGGRDVKGLHWVPGRSDLWKAGNSLEIMYARSQPGESQPASLGYYLTNELGWQMAHLAMGAGLIMAGVGSYVVRRTRLKHGWLHRAIRTGEGETTG